MAHGVVALNAVRVVFEIGDPEFVCNFLGFWLAMESQEGVVMRRSLPSLDFGGMALFAALVADDLVRIDCQLPLFVARIRLPRRRCGHSHRNGKQKQCEPNEGFSYTGG